MDLDQLRCALSPILTDYGQGNVKISSVSNFASKVTPGAVFCAIRGAKADGHDHIPEAQANGAAALVVSHTWNGAEPAKIPVLRVRDSYHAWAILCEEMAERPADAFHVHTVTGTNGKTTIAFILRHILRYAGHHTGLLTTVITDSGDGVEKDAAYTMPDAQQLQMFFSEMRENNVQDAIMESSSHGLHQHRCGSLMFASAIFTNLTGDHLDYHHTMEEYYQAKRLLFVEMLAPDAPCVINIDDPYGKRLSEELAQAGITNQTFSAQEPAFCRLTGFEARNDGSRLQFQLDGKDYTIHSKLRGEHNAVNLLQTVTVAYALGIPMETILLAAESAPPAPGRLECITLENGATAYVDFAHTHDALERVLLALKKIRRNNGRIITVFGCGGDRDRTKRPKMGFAAGTHSDICIVTSDNPRSEDPDFIISEILPGIPAGVQYHAEPDRRKAILLALDMAKKDDIILIAGKGHEKTQEIKGVKYPFSDAEVIRNR